MYEYVMIPIIMYESEICTMTESERLERFRMECLRSMVVGMI